MISTNDIYDVAACMRQEFERLMTIHGPDCVSQLIPKTVYVLELLEHLTDASQKKNAELEELHSSVEKLKVDKEAHLVEREKYKKELEILEESWKKELHELASYTKQLQEENQRLFSMTHDQSILDQAVQSDAQSPVLLMEQIAILRETMLKQCDEIRMLHHELDEKSCEVEAMQSQIERLLKLNADCWQRNNLTKQHTECLLQEIVDLQLAIKEREQLIDKLKKQLALLEKSVEVDGTTRSSHYNGSEDTAKKCDESGAGEDADLPKFTLGELRGVLNERNKLKMRLYEMEEELERLCPSSPVLTNIGAEMCDMRNGIDLPVEGPINREPEEKLYPRGSGTPSIIRRIFKHFLESFDQSENDGK